eukprot:154635_1
MPRTNHIVLLDQLITIFGVAANPTLNSQLDRNQNIIELEENCILLRNMFDIEEQCELYSAIIKISALTLKGKIKANKNWTRLMRIQPTNKAHKGRNSPIYDKLFDRTFNTLYAMNNIKTKLPSLSSIGKHTMRANLYPAPHGNIYRHYDKRNGYVLLYSLGCSIIFYVKGPQMDKKNGSGITFEMHSGDILLFDASTRARIEHGVDKVLPGTCPVQLLQKIKKHPKFDLNNVRISVQTRFHIEKE